MSIYRRGSLDLWNFDDAIVPDDGDVVTVDLSETTFVDAYGLVGIACQILQAADHGQEVAFLAPGCPAARPSSDGRREASLDADAECAKAGLQP